FCSSYRCRFNASVCRDLSIPCLNHRLRYDKRVRPRGAGCKNSRAYFLGDARLFVRRGHIDSCAWSLVCAGECSPCIFAGRESVSCWRKELRLSNEPRLSSPSRGGLWPNAEGFLSINKG